LQPLCLQTQLLRLGLEFVLLKKEPELELALEWESVLVLLQKKELVELLEPVLVLEGTFYL
jgi:hypothetical protein